MPVLYGEQSIRPVQGVEIDKVPVDLGDGRKVASTVRATIRGELVADVTDGVFAAVDSATHMTTLLQKQQALRDVFSRDGLLFQVQGWDGIVAFQFAAKVVSINFADGNLFEVCPYTVVLEGPDIGGEEGQSFHIESAGESWSFEEFDYPLLSKATHTVTCKGKTTYDGAGNVAVPAWENARTFVQSQLGLGWTAVGGYSTLSGQQLAAQSAEKPVTNATAYNHIVSENLDETEGTYAATESWVLHTDVYWEEYTCAVRRTASEPNLSVSVDVQGTIHGLYVVQHDLASRTANALQGWTTVQTLLQGRASAAAGVALNARPEVSNHDEDRPNGVVTYQATFTDRAITNDTWEQYTVEARSNLADPYVTVSVNGTITGLLYPDSETDISLRAQRARAQFAAIEGQLYARAVAESGVQGLQAYPLNAQKVENPADGTLSYSFEYDTRPNPYAIETYTVTLRYARDEARQFLVVSGRITGLRVPTNGSDPFAATDPSTRYDNALAYFQGIKPALLSRAAIYVPTSNQYPTPWSQSEEHDPYGGTINYSYEFTNLQVCFPGALSEVITVTETDSIPVIAEFGIPGRPSGPIIQDIGTVTARKRTLSLEIVYPIPKLPCVYSPPTVDPSPWAPQGSLVRFDQPPTRQWVQNLGRFSGTWSWVYLP